NLGSRLVGLSRRYGVDIVVSEATRAQAPGFVWQRLDRVRVQGKAQAVDVYTPLGRADQVSSAQNEELRIWNQAWAAWLAREWAACETLLQHLQAQNEEKVLYRLYAQRVALMQQSPPGPEWDGATQMVTK